MQHRDPTRPPGRAYLSAATAPPPANTAWWSWALGFVLFVVGYFAAGVALYIFLPELLPDSWTAAVGYGPRGGFAEALLLWLSFVPAMALPFLLWAGLHRLPWRRLVSAWNRVRWGFVLRAFVVVTVGYVLCTAVDYALFPDSYADFRLQTDWGAFAVLLVMTLVFCPIQAASEEVFVRGYLNTALMNWLHVLPGAPWVVFALTSALFASLHLGNPESDGQVLPYMAGTFVFGFGMCVLVWFEGGLESAVGYHIANNIFVFGLVGYDDPTLPSSALLSQPEITVEFSDVAVEVVAMSLFIALILRWNRRSGPGALTPPPGTRAPAGRSG